MARVRILKNERGQAFLEALFGIPALILVLSVLVLSLAMFNLRVHLVFVAQELATCRISVKSASECEQQAHEQTRLLLSQWGFHDLSIGTSSDLSQALLSVQARWGTSPWAWSLRWSFREQIPFPRAEL